MIEPIANPIIKPAENTPRPMTAMHIHMRSARPSMFIAAPMIFARHAAPLPAWALMLLARDGLGLAVAALP